jgi:hypothetical protein
VTQVLVNSPFTLRMVVGIAILKTTRGTTVANLNFFGEVPTRTSSPSSTASSTSVMSSGAGPAEPR